MNSLQINQRRDQCRSPIESLLALPTSPQDNDLFLASGDNSYGDAITYFRGEITKYIVPNAPFFSEKILVPLVRELRIALVGAHLEKSHEYMRGAETDRGFARRTLEEFISLTYTINLGCKRAKRSTTLKRIFKILEPQARNELRSLEVSHVEIELGLNKSPKDGCPAELLEDFIAQRRLCGTGIENIMRNQLTLALQSRR